MFLFGCVQFICSSSTQSMKAREGYHHPGANERHKSPTRAYYSLNGSNNLFFSHPSFSLLLNFLFTSLAKMKFDLNERLQRTESYQRLVEKLKRNPSERVDTKDWPRPNTPKEVIQHAIKGAVSKDFYIYHQSFCLTLFFYKKKNQCRSFCFSFRRTWFCQFLFILNQSSEGKVCFYFVQLELICMIFKKNHL